jgi:hypothetical protein
MYTLRQFPYCGLSMPADKFDEHGAARAAAAALLRRRRRAGYPVAVIMRGAEWEVREPDGAAMVPDACGTIALERVTFECQECGSYCDTADAARECCALAGDCQEYLFHNPEEV